MKEFLERASSRKFLLVTAGIILGIVDAAYTLNLPMAEIVVLIGFYVGAEGAADFKRASEQGERLIESYGYPEVSGKGE